MAIISEFEALEKLKSSHVVALPTETVYGLAGRVDDDKALERIFSTKERPFFDPLIVHVSDLEQAKEWAFFDEVSEKLAHQFWPGPLTLVLDKKDKVSDLITNGGPTVALRSPDHPAFQSILKKIDTPLAAPSANMFGKTSPTMADHVESEFAGEVDVVDGGPCQTGIESTVLQVSPQTKNLVILRPGSIDESQLNEFIRQHRLPFKVQRKQMQHVPGHLKNHYQPSVPLVLIDHGEGASLKENDIIPHLKTLNGGPWEEMTVPKDSTLAARTLYSDLRDFSQRNQAFYIRLDPEWRKQSLWDGFCDRIEKAATAHLVYQKGQWQLRSKA